MTQRPEHSRESDGLIVSLGLKKKLLLSDGDLQSQTVYP